ncbi:Uncharacterized protein YehS [hydrothermal vent metagenome]|uniref:Uncharacterized protein YehS n=1 Tax=hydrothermal vent metagenome TaxID=652676 RepID=A0A3B0RGF0_9ZZZZ
MTNNDIIRQIRYIFDYNDSKMIEIFDSAGLEVTRSQVSNWLKKDDNAAYVEITDNQLAYFLNGLINEKRGKKKGPPMIAENRLNNNIIFRKIRIALNLKDDQIVKIMSLVDMRIGKAELGAFFRKPGHPKYMVCKDQFLRNFLHGIQKEYHKNN